MAMLEEDFAARTKVFANRETALYLELTNIRQSGDGRTRSKDLASTYSHG